MNLRSRFHAGAWLAIVMPMLLNGCSGKPASGFLERGATTGGRFTQADDRIKIAVLPYSADMAQEVFGIDFSRSDQMAVEIAVENLSAGNGRTFVFRRHHCLAVFDDGTRRYPIDPMKVYQKNRVDKSGPYILFGVTGYALAAAADSNRRAGLADASERELRLTPEAPSASGFLYFDTAGITGRQLTELIVEYEEVGVDELWRTTVDLGRFEYRPPPPPSDASPQAHDRKRGIDW